MMSVENLTFHQTLGDLLQGLTQVARKDDVNVTGITSDSRSVQKGDLFIAYQNTEVMDYVRSAIDSGASAIIMESEQSPYVPKFNVPVIALPQLRAQAGLIAARFFGHPSHAMNVIGVTGTNGKTTVSYLIAQACALHKQGQSGLIGTLGYGRFDQITKGPNTTPEPVALQNIFATMQQQNIDQVAMEVSSHGLEEYRVAGVEFDVAVFTNLSRDHLDYHPSMQAYAESKRRLFSDYLITKAAFNIDDAFGRELLEEFKDKIEAVAYTLNNGHTHDFPVVSAQIIPGDKSRLTLAVKSPWGEGTLVSELVGQFNASNLLAALAALCLSGMSFTGALANLSRCSSVPGRMESFRKQGKPLVVVDYAHTPDALTQVLKTSRELASGKLICVFGCGGDRDKGKRVEMGQIAEAYADQIILTNDNPRGEDAERIIEDIISGIKTHACFTKETDRKKAINMAIDTADSNDVILIAGKGHEDYQEINGVRHPFSDRLVVAAALHLDLGLGLALGDSDSGDKG